MMTELQAVTVVTRSHMPHVRTLAASLAATNPGVRLNVVLVDDPAGRDSDIAPTELVPANELHRRALIYDAQGLISSLRPLAVAYLLDAGAGAVVLLDADMLALGPLEDLWIAAAEHGVLLSPHTINAGTNPLTIASDERFLVSGTFNGGVLGVGWKGSPFLDWIAARVARDCVRDPARGLLYSQTWLNLVPGLFDHHVLRDAGVNVTAHRLAGRDLEPFGAAPDHPPELDGAPLRLFHFTGFDPGTPDVFCRYLAGPAGTFEGRIRLERLCAEYAERLRANGWPADDAYVWDSLASGAAVDPALRRRYREALLAHERGDGPQPPDPYDPAQTAGFEQWRNER